MRKYFSRTPVCLSFGESRSLTTSAHDESPRTTAALPLQSPASHFRAISPTEATPYGRVPGAQPLWLEYLLKSEISFSAALGGAICWVMISLFSSARP